MAEVGCQNSYLVIKGQSDDKYHVSVGAGFTIRNNMGLFRNMFPGLKYNKVLYVVNDEDE